MRRITFSENEKDINGIELYGLSGECLYYTIIIPDFKYIDTSNINRNNYDNKGNNDYHKYELITTVDNCLKNKLFEDVIKEAKTIVNNVIANVKNTQ